MLLEIPQGEYLLCDGTGNDCFSVQVAQCYPDKLSGFPQELSVLLKRHSTVLHPEMRMSFVKALVLLRNKNLLSPTDLHMLFFQLLHCPVSLPFDNSHLGKTQNSRQDY